MSKRKAKPQPVAMPPSIAAPKQWRISAEPSREHTVGYVVAHGLDVKAVFYEKCYAELFVSTIQGISPASEICQQFVALWPVVNGRDKPKATPEVISVWTAAREFLKTHGESK